MQVEEILSRFGVVCVQREGNDELEMVLRSDSFLQRFAERIIIARPTVVVVNNIGSSRVRQLMEKGLSAKFIVDDSVLRYIEVRGLYNCKLGSQNTLPSRM